MSKAAAMKIAKASRPSRPEATPGKVEPNDR
jgi:hypothetical protein